MRQDVKLILNEDFQYEGKPSENLWNFDIGPWPHNNELEYYTDNLKNCFVKDGLLHIVAHKEKKEMRNYTSARIKTKGKFDFMYGRLEVKAKVPEGRGLWPAIWMMSTNETYGHWPNSGEIDIMEYIGGDRQIQSVLHTAGYNHINQKQRKGYATNFDPSIFHVFAFEWDETTMKFYVDDKMHYEVSFDEKKDGDNKWQAWPFNEPFYLIINLAVGGFLGSKNGFDEDCFPQEFLIDYVKVYQ